MSRRKRRTYLTLIALSAVGVVVDRLVGPATSVGAELAVRGPRAHPPAVVPVRGPGPAPGSDAAAVVLTAARFPRGLPTAETPERNIFGPSESVRRAWKGGPADNASGIETAPNDGELAAAQFADTHALSAVVSDRDFSMAVVDGRSVRLGADLDGCRLSKVTGQSAFFDCAGAIVELSVGGESSADVGLKSGGGEVDEPHVAEHERRP
jgi:hypothetical protein